jgi:16S rRNA processing protein RimM
MAQPEYVIVGRIRKSHGVQGDVVVEPITDAPAAVFAAGRRLLVGTQDGDLAAGVPPVRVERARAAPGGGLLVRFDAIADRTEADRWRERYLLLPYDEVEPPREGEAFLHELVGMSVERSSGEKVGDVLEVFELPQGLALDVSWRGGRVLLPFRGEFVRAVDRHGRRIVMDPPDGLLE